MEQGRRERKKQQTRQALLDAAVKLFRDKGYEQTTTAEIAAAADVASRTFFLHFPAKEDVLLATSNVRVEAGLQVIADRRPGEPVTGVLVRMADEMIINSWSTDLSTGMAALRAKLITSTPALQNLLLTRLFAAQNELTEAVRQAFGIDETEAAALIGGLIGAINAVALVGMRRADPPDKIRDDMRRAVRILLHSESADS
jgi:AcrR family transcriptional regulator